MSEPAPRVVGVYETVVYATDVTATTRFYSKALGLHLLGEPTELSAAFRLPDGGGEEGSRSVYVRDPAGNSVEVVEGEAWRMIGPDTAED